MKRTEFLSIRVFPEEKKAILKKYGSSDKVREYLLEDNNWYGSIFDKIEESETNITDRLEDSMQAVLSALSAGKKKKPAVKKPMKEEITELVYPIDSQEFKDAWAKWIQYKKDEHNDRYKKISTEQTAIDRLCKLANNDPILAIDIIDFSISNKYHGLILDPNRKPKSEITTGMITNLIVTHFGKKPTSFFMETLKNSGYREKIIASERAANYIIQDIAKQSNKDFTVAIAILKGTLNNVSTKPETGNHAKLKTEKPLINNSVGKKE